MSLRQRHDLLARFLNSAEYLDIELRSAPALRPLLVLAEKNNLRRIISFHDFKLTPRIPVLIAKARKAKAHGAHIFKIATRTDNPMQLRRLLDFTTNSGAGLPLAVMGIGRFGAISRVLLARTGSVLLYASLGEATSIEGQLPLEQLREMGIGTMTKSR